MSSVSTTVQPGTLIAIKVNHDGSNKKVKLPFSDLAAATFEDKLRFALSISPSSNCHFERYSDSAGRYVVLNRFNTSVYKQLLRAAKAKQKLKLRVVYPESSAKESTSCSEEPSKVNPRPVTIEDVPESTPAPTIAPAKPPKVPVPTASASTERATSPPAAIPSSNSVHQDVSALVRDFSGEALQSQSTPDSMEKAGTSWSHSEAQSGGCARSTSVCSSATQQPAFTVCCNTCERNIPDSHYHCSTCEEGDFDLCEDCIALGVSCYNPEHWLIRRNIQNGLIVNSTTERIPPKSKLPKSTLEPVQFKSVPIRETKEVTGPFIERCYQLPVRPTQTASSSTATDTQPKSSFSDIIKPLAHSRIRTCNNCIRELSEPQFLHCTECYDFDLCKDCFVKNNHGHHPKHSFTPAVKGTVFDWDVTRLLSAGRGQRHNAICDNCDTFISGVRHKCLDCPDWDYCSDCVLKAPTVHPDHRFLPIYEPLSETVAGKMLATPSLAIHTGITCDGPHCAGFGHNYRYIVGDRYKCAVCNNKDFCATCEASPANQHNKTHPLIKFRTPVRHVSVTTTGEHGNGCQMPVMGDHKNATFCHLGRAQPKAPESETEALGTKLQLNKVQTVLNVKPTVTERPSSDAVPATKAKAKTVSSSSSVTLAEPAAEDLGATFRAETITDGTVLPPNHVFEQTWVLRNTGSVAWPAGCCIRFVNGDYMGHVDPNHPAGIQELVSASESTICYEPLAPGEEFSFTVLLRTPPRPGNVVSYWRLTTKGGIKFGDRLWCEVHVQAKANEEPSPAKAISEKVEEVAPVEVKEESVEKSQMIFPKLEKESPVASIHEPEVSLVEDTRLAEEQSDFDEWADDDSESDSGFLTDEEYDILDASDEEFVEEPAKIKSQRK